METKKTNIDYVVPASTGRQTASESGFNCNGCGDALSPEELDFGFTETCTTCTERLDRAAANRSKESQNRPR
jgi:hypothetical protein